MRFIAFNGVIVEVSDDIVRRLISTELRPNPYWSFNQDIICEREVLAYLKGSEDPEILRKVAYYLRFFTENMILSVYIMLRALGDSNAEDYLNYGLKLVEKIREKCMKAEKQPSREHIWEIISTLLENGLDPF